MGEVVQTVVTDELKLTHWRSTVYSQPLSFSSSFHALAVHSWMGYYTKHSAGNLHTFIITVYAYSTVMSCATDWPVASLGVYFFLKNLATYFAHRCHYHYHFLLLSLGCHPTPFSPVRPRFSTILYKFAHKQFFPSGVTPLEGVTRGGPPTPLPPLVTPLLTE